MLLSGGAYRLGEPLDLYFGVLNFTFMWRTLRAPTIAHGPVPPTPSPQSFASTTARCGSHIKTPKLELGESLPLTCYEVSMTLLTQWLSQLSMSSSLSKDLKLECDHLNLIGQHCHPSKTSCGSTIQLVRRIAFSFAFHFYTC